PIPELSRYFSSLRFSRMLLRFSRSKDCTESRSARTSKKVKWPHTSIRATWSCWRIFTEKFTRNNLSYCMAIITRQGPKVCRDKDTGQQPAQNDRVACGASLPPASQRRVRL